MEPDSVIPLFLALGLILIAARIAGAVARRLGQPRVLGELVVGLLLGPTLFGLFQSSFLGLDSPAIAQTIEELAQLGVLLLMFYIGMEVQLSELARVGNVGILAGVGGSLLTVAFAALFLLFFAYTWQLALFAGVALAATSVSISAQVLLELGLLRTKVGSALLAAALIDDIVAILLVSVVVPVITHGGEIDPWSMAGIVARIVVYLGLAGLTTWFVVPRMLNWINAQRYLEESYGVPALALALVLLYGWSAVYFGGVAAITGAFIAGIGVARVKTGVKRQIEEAITNLAYVFLVPIFFVSIGLSADLRGISLSILPLALGLLAAAVGGKILGCGLGALGGGLRRHEALQLGVSMIPQGEVSLIVASLGISAGIFKASDPLFLALFLTVLLTTILAPMFVRRVFRTSSTAPLAGGG